jgi:hypothetical protein
MRAERRCGGFRADNDGRRFRSRRFKYWRFADARQPGFFGEFAGVVDEVAFGLLPGSPTPRRRQG